MLGLVPWPLEGQLHLMWPFLPKFQQTPLPVALLMRSNECNFLCQSFNFFTERLNILVSSFDCHALAASIHIKGRDGRGTVSFVENRTESSGGMK